MSKPSDYQRYQTMINDQSRRATEMRSVLLNPQVEGNSFIADKNARNEALSRAIGGSIFESLGKSAGFVVGATANGLRAYCQHRGKAPSDEVLAAAHKAIENLCIYESVAPKIDNGQKSAIYESVANMSTTDGMVMRDHMVAIVLPTMLNTITSDMVTTCPANFDRSEIFRITTVAGSTFGDLQKGDVINETFNGQYGTLDQCKLLGLGDGTKTTFTLTVGMPLKKGSGSGGYVRVLLDRMEVAKDNGSGAIFGVMVNQSTVNYDTGEIQVVFNTAPAAGLEVHVTYDIDIEADPSLIPMVSHTIKAYELLPHESAIRGELSLQALHSASREYGIDMSALTLNAMRNTLAADKDRKRLRQMWFIAKGEHEWDMAVPSGASYYEHYETVRTTLMNISTSLVNGNLRSGLVGLVAGKMACNTLRTLRSPHFVPAPNYRELAQPHYVGRLFETWDLYCDPGAPDPWKALCFAKGMNHGEAGYIAADAITAVPLKHPVGTDLRYRDTMWELSYRDPHPYDGREWFTILKVINS